MNLSTVPVHNRRENPMRTQPNVVITPVKTVMSISGPELAFMLAVAFVLGAVSLALFLIALTEPIL